MPTAPLTASFFSKEFTLHFLVTITSVQFVRLKLLVDVDHTETLAG